MDVLTADSIDKAICVKVMLPLSPSIVEFARYFEVKVYVESPKRCLYLYALILLDIFPPVLSQARSVLWRTRNLAFSFACHACIRSPLMRKDCEGQSEYSLFCA